MTRRMMLGLCGFAALGLLAPGLVAPVAAQPAGPSVTKVWARATAPSAQNGAAYFTLGNDGPADTLTGASTPVSAMAELHRTINDNGTMKMRPVKSIAVAHGSTTTFAPGGYHVMLMGLKQPLKPGETFPLTLTFAKAGKMTVTATVQGAGAMAPGGAAAPMGDMPGMSGMSGMQDMHH